MTSTTQAPRTVLDAIGDTPLVAVEGVWAKLEYLNPSGSIKARLARYVIERAEREGLLAPGDTVVEASSGNTGNALAMVAAVKGYRMVVVMPSGMSNERAAISRAFGAEVVEVGRFHVSEALEVARELGARPGYFCPEQFANEWNVIENREWLGAEILEQLPPGVAPDALVTGVGTGGSLIGLGQAFRARNPACLLVAVEPDESCTIACGDVDEHPLEGIADGFVPELYRRHQRDVDQVVAVTGPDALDGMRRLARDHGIFVGPSSGAHLVAAQRVRAERPGLTHVVTLLCDEGEKYLSEHFDDGEAVTSLLDSPYTGGVDGITATLRPREHPFEQQRRR